MSAIDVAARAEARIAASEFVELAHGMAESMSDDAAHAFWRDIQDAAGAKVPKSIAPVLPAKQPMNEQQAKHFEVGTMPYGRFSGIRIGKLMEHTEGREHLDWLVDAPDDFKVDLRRYLLSERGRARMEGRAF